MALITLDDFHEGEIREFGSYPVTLEEILDFARKYDPQPFHINPEAARQSNFGGIIASGWHTCGMMMRMLCDHLFSGSAGTGSPGVDEIRWLRPVRPGDVLRLKVETTRVALSRSKPDRGTIWHTVSVLNQNDELVMTMKAMTMMLTRAGAATKKA